MEGRSQGITFQRANVIFEDPLEDIPCLTPNWYLTINEIEDHSPSRRDHIDLRKEKQLRTLYSSFVLDLGMKLKVPQVTIATAMMFCHRFYMHQSHAKNDWQTIATVSMFLACKVEETPRLLVDVIVVAYETLHRRDPTASQKIKQKNVYEKQKELILIGERLLMATIGFDFNIQHPYKPLVAALKKLDISHKDVAKVAWNFVNDWLRSTLCVQYKPHYIAAGSLYLAAKFCQVKLPSERGKVWWLEFDVSPHQLEVVIKQMLRLLEGNKKSQIFSSHEKVTQAVLVKKATSSNSESCVLNECKSTSKEKAVVGGRSAQSNDACACDSHVKPRKDICVVRNGEISQCQTSDCGSSQSVVEDGNRTDESEVQARLKEFGNSAACKIVFDCGGLSKIDKDRIKEALKKRKYERAANKKVVTTLDDDEDNDSWIARELENGIELGSASAQKRQRELLFGRTAKII